MSWNVWNRPSGSFMVDMVISSNIMKSPFPKCYRTWPCTMTPSIDQTLHQFANLLPNWTLLPILTLLPNFECFHRTLQRVWLANRRRLLLRTPGPVPFGTCICSNVETILSWTCHVYGPFEFRTSLGTSILLLWLKPIYTYNVGSKNYHMQQYFDCTVILKRYKANVSMVTFWKAPGCDRQKYNLRREVDFWRGRMRYGWSNSRDKEHQFVSCVYILKYLIKLWKAHARFISCFLISKKKHTRGEKGYEFLSYVLIMWL